MSTVTTPFPVDADLFTFCPALSDYWERWVGLDLTPFETTVKERAERLAVELQLLIRAHHPRMSLVMAYDFVKHRHTFPDAVTADAVLEFLEEHWMYYGKMNELRAHIGLTKTP